jgi:AraC-like DNA-binding protein
MASGISLAWAPVIRSLVSASDQGWISESVPDAGWHVWLLMRFRSGATITLCVWIKTARSRKRGSTPLCRGLAFNHYKIRAASYAQRSNLILWQDRVLYITKKSNWEGIWQQPLLPASALPSHILRRVLERMNSEFSEDLSLADLAAESGYSRAHFLQMFRASTGQAPHQLA